MQSAVQIHRLTRHFRDFWRRIRVTAVQDVSFSVPAGSIVGLLGPNGSGKSTTLKILLGLLRPSSGSAEVLGGSPRNRLLRARIGYLPEISALYRYLSAEETLRFYAGLHNLPGDVARRRTAELLEMTGLAHAAARPVGSFSRGMNRRIGLAQALINNPDLIILDEPTAGLDPMGCRQVKDLLLALAACGKTVLVSSHLLADIEDICDRIVVLHHGRVIAEGALAELLEQRQRIRFTLDAVTGEQAGALQAAFRDITGREAHADHPRLALETFFLETVEQASARQVQPPSGVVRTGALAPFLCSPS